MNLTPDVLVIGTGSAGYTLAYACREAGLSVSIVDNRPYGGTCAMRGCQPKKYLVAAAEVAHMAHSMAEIGIKPGVEMDWKALMKSKSAFTDAVPESTEKGFLEAGMETLHGTAKFISPEEVQIGGETIVRPGKIVIATGARPVPLGFPGEDLVATSEDFLVLPEMPKRIAFIGGGYISMEFAHVARVAGAEVTVLHRSGRILKNFEPEIVDELSVSAKDMGIDIVTDYEVCGVERKSSGLVVSGGEDCRGIFEADLVVHGAGRMPNFEGLDLEKGGVTHSRKGVAVDDFLQNPSNPRVYAIGDACQTPLQLATTADMNANVASENIIHGNRAKMDYKNVPSVVFTLPPMASVGMTEEDAKKAGKKFSINRGGMAGYASSKRIGQKYARYKVIVEEETGHILGAHFIGHNAGETINVFALALKFGHTAADLKSVLWAYPTHSSDLKYTI